MARTPISSISFLKHAAENHVYGLRLELKKKKNDLMETNRKSVSRRSEIFQTWLDYPRHRIGHYTGVVPSNVRASTGQVHCFSTHAHLATEISHYVIVSGTRQNGRTTLGENVKSIRSPSVVRPRRKSQVSRPRDL